ncbi:MAG: tRNA 2-thiouridine synthesizing protein C [Candidatus Endobugula sp.]|jgi:tRNA 2-thiouridine synthesizing protein C
MTRPTKKKILFILRHAPYGSSLAKEGIDAILATSAYEQDLSVVFIDDGVFQLTRDHHTESIEQKNISRVLVALPIYDITQLFVCASSLRARGINHVDLQEGIASLDHDALQQLCKQQDHLLSF